MDDELGYNQPQLTILRFRRKTGRNFLHTPDNCGGVGPGHSWQSQELETRSSIRCHWCGMWRDPLLRLVAAVAVPKGTRP